MPQLPMRDIFEAHHWGSKSKSLVDIKLHVYILFPTYLHTIHSPWSSYYHGLIPNHAKHTIKQLCILPASKIS